MKLPRWTQPLWRFGRRKREDSKQPYKMPENPPPLLADLRAIAPDEPRRRNWDPGGKLAKKGFVSLDGEVEVFRKIPVWLKSSADQPRQYHPKLERYATTGTKPSELIAERAKGVVRARKGDEAHFFIGPEGYYLSVGPLGGPENKIFRVTNPKFVRDLDLLLGSDGKANRAGLFNERPSGYTRSIAIHDGNVKEYVQRNRRFFSGTGKTPSEVVINTIAKILGVEREKVRGFCIDDHGGYFLRVKYKEKREIYYSIRNPRFLEVIRLTRGL